MQRFRSITGAPAAPPRLCQYGSNVSTAQSGHKGTLDELILVLSNGGATRAWPASLRLPEDGRGGSHDDEGARASPSVVSDP
ncbi:hypothetical protein QLX08_009055 [Tetragonisca angustula]|uniref:Uncharacterized protein n=1 Tax=Tetragonisca angustula TaxID=166442 RepID=A0AAW0ZKA7_9HYME